MSWVRGALDDAGKRIRGDEDTVRRHIPPRSSRFPSGSGDIALRVVPNVVAAMHLAMSIADEPADDAVHDADRRTAIGFFEQRRTCSVVAIPDGGPRDARVRVGERSFGLNVAPIVLESLRAGEHLPDLFACRGNVDDVRDFGFVHVPFSRLSRLVFRRAMRNLLVAHQ